MLAEPKRAGNATFAAAQRSYGTLTAMASNLDHSLSDGGSANGGSADGGSDYGASDHGASDHGHPENLPRRRIALIAHDNKKTDITEWARFNRALLAQHDLCATRTTGKLLIGELGLPVTCLRSGPLGGDQQIGARIAEGRVDMLVFFWDPLEPHPHDPDVKALLRLAVAWNLPVACNRASADFMISSPLFSRRYDRLQPDFDDYANRGWAAVAASADQVA
jgi:methylglyoxal synthase